MIAKIIVHADDRNEAIARLDAALSETRIGGLANNINFVRTCLQHEEFRRGNVYTDFIPDYEADLLPKTRQRSERSIVEGVCARILLSPRKNTPLGGPFGEASYFRPNHTATFELQLDDGLIVSAQVDAPSQSGGAYFLRVKDRKLRLSDILHSATANTRLAQCAFILETEDGERQRVHAVQLRDSLDVSSLHSRASARLSVFKVYGAENASWPFAREDANYDEAASDDVDLKARSPMPGVIDRVNVSVGDVVKAGQALVVMIAMKMEYVLK